MILSFLMILGSFCLFMMIQEARGMIEALKTKKSHTSYFLLCSFIFSLFAMIFLATLIEIAKLEFLGG